MNKTVGNLTPGHVRMGLPTALFPEWTQTTVVEILQMWTVRNPKTLPMVGSANAPSYVVDFIVTEQ
jgi:hypothetical protein